MLLPGVTGFGNPELVTARSAWPVVATVVVAIAALFPAFGSGVDAARWRCQKNGSRRRTRWHIHDDRERGSAGRSQGRDGAGDRAGPTGGRSAEAHPLGTTRETNVAFTVAALLLAVFSVKTKPEAVPGPLLVTTAVIVKLEPARTVGEDAVLVTARSACVAVPTVVMTVAVLLARFGSFVPEVTLSTSTICVPLVVPFPTCTTTVKLTFPPFAKSGFVQDIVPVPPTAGVAQVHPATLLMDSKTVFAGMPSLKTTLTASSGPLFVTVCV